MPLANTYKKSRETISAYIANNIKICALSKKILQRKKRSLSDKALQKRREYYQRNKEAEQFKANHVIMTENTGNT